MRGLMMERPLLISSLLRHAELNHADQEVVSRRVEGDIHRYTFRDLAARSRRLANALAALGVKHGDRVATLAWNGYRHLELYYAVSGCGAVLHTLNPRLHPDQLTWIANHAQDRVLFFDLTFLPLIESIAPRLQGVWTFVALTDRAHMPATTNVRDLVCYEDLLEAYGEDYEWPEFDENTAATLCTPQVRPAIPRAPCTVTARRCCTPMPWRCPMPSIARRATSCCPWCRCST